jgi:hypothetical protein
MVLESSIRQIFSPSGCGERRTRMLSPREVDAACEFSLVSSHLKKPLQSGFKKDLQVAKGRPLLAPSL